MDMTGSLHVSKCMLLAFWLSQLEVLYGFNRTASHFVMTFGKLLLEE